MMTCDPDLPEEVRVLSSVKCNLAIAPKSLAYRLVSADNGSVVVEWLGADSRSTADLLADGRSHRGENSLRVEGYVNSRLTTKSADVALALGLDLKLANQELTRLRDAGRIRRIYYGVYGPLNAPDPEGPEGYGEGHAHLEVSADSGIVAGQSDPHDPRSLHLADAVAVHPQASTCPEHGTPIGGTAKCITCVVERAEDEVERHRVANIDPIASEGSRS